MEFRAHARAPIGAGIETITRAHLEQIVVQGFESWFILPSCEEFRNHFADDVVLTNHCPPHLTSFGGEHRGFDRLLAACRALRTDFIFLEPSVDSILADGFHLAVSYSIRLRHVGTGGSARLVGMAQITVTSDLRIRRIENFFDSATLAEVGDLLESFAARAEALDCKRRAALAASPCLSSGGS